MQLHTAAFAFMEEFVNTHTWVKMTLSIEDVLLALHLAPRFQWKGKRALKECLRWKASSEILLGPRCVSGERECSRGPGSTPNSAFAPNVVTDAYRPHPPAIGAEWSIPRIRPVP